MNEQKHIVSAKYTNVDSSSIEATFNTGEIQYIPYPCKGSGCKYLISYEAQGGTIDPYVEEELEWYDAQAEIEALEVRVAELEKRPGPPGITAQE